MAGIPVEEITAEEALRREPQLHPGTQRAFTVPDATIDGWRMVWGCARDVERRGGSVLTYHELEDLIVEDDRVLGAKVKDVRTGEIKEIRADITVSASGAWAGRVAQLADCEVSVKGGRGIMIAMNHRLVQAVVNRCRMPGDSDILVPIRTVSVLGTTDSPTDDPEDTSIPAAEIQQMIDDGAEMIPHLADARALRVWAGIRPLYSAKPTANGDTRDISRDYALLDHREHDCVDGFVTITGGKLTTARLMGEKAVDMVCERLGVTAACTTADEPLPGSEHNRPMQITDRLETREETLHSDQAICECELVSRGMLLEAQANRPTNNLDDLRRTLRLGMGPCQGGFCIPRAAAALVAADRMDAATANRAIESFSEERWKGVWPLLEPAARPVRRGSTSGSSTARSTSGTCRNEPHRGDRRRARRARVRASHRRRGGPVIGDLDGRRIAPARRRHARRAGLRARPRRRAARGAERAARQPPLPARSAASGWRPPSPGCATGCPRCTSPATASRTCSCPPPSAPSAPPPPPRPRWPPATCAEADRSCSSASVAQGLRAPAGRGQRRAGRLPRRREHRDARRRHRDARGQRARHLAARPGAGLRRPRARLALVAAVKRPSAPPTAPAVGLPAVLGANYHPDAYAAMSDALGTEVFEVPTIPPSVPGIRLYRALTGELRLAAAG